jgi:hypothetical protein
MDNPGYCRPFELSGHLTTYLRLQLNVEAISKHIYYFDVDLDVAAARIGKVLEQMKIKRPRAICSRSLWKYRQLALSTR